MGTSRRTGRRRLDLLRFDAAGSTSATATAIAPPLHLVDEDGRVEANGRTWLQSASAEDRRVLARAVGPVLDVGCGPGRHVRALQALGVEVLGIDLTPSVLETATSRGATVLAASVFDPLPRMGQWRTALLLDGNLGVGGNPLGLLLRLRCVLAFDGRVLADLATGPPVRLRRMRLRHGQSLGPDFNWAPLHLDDLPVIAGIAGFEVVEVWQSSDRWYCELAVRPGCGAGTAGVGAGVGASSRPTGVDASLTPAGLATRSVC